MATAFVGAKRGRARRVAKAAVGAFPVPLLLGPLPAVALAAAAGAGGWIPVWAPLLTAAALAGLAAALILRPEPKSEPEPSAPAGQAPSKIPASALAIGLLAAPVALAALALADRRGSAGHVAMGLILMLALAFIALVVPPATIAATFVARLLRTLPRNLFGLCTGNGPTGDASRPALTPWLAEYLDCLAGVPSDGPGRRPLTFGDLDRHEITLQTMTSNLTAARGFRLPFEDDGREHWHFDPAEFRRLFPAYVVDWMASPARHPESVGTRPDGKLPLPPRADFPVVVAARMSLSFPFLLSAVPLYTHRGVRARRRPGAEPAKEHQPLVRCWFSDGGLVSNFPLHFFDSPLPRWPTFAINLRGFPAGRRPAKDPCANV
ncbi:MAG: patatin-like phospholipase family protein [Thermomicrobiales bacterium]